MTLNVNGKGLLSNNSACDRMMCKSCSTVIVSLGIVKAYTWSTTMLNNEQYTEKNRLQGVDRELIY